MIFLIFIRLINLNKIFLFFYYVQLKEYELIKMRVWYQFCSLLVIFILGFVFFYVILKYDKEYDFVYVVDEMWMKLFFLDDECQKE